MDEHISKYMKGQCQGGEEAEEIQTKDKQRISMPPDRVIRMPVTPGGTASAPCPQESHTTEMGIVWGS